VIDAKWIHSMHPPSSRSSVLSMTSDKKLGGRVLYGIDKKKGENKVE
jgi:hypothetical protein